MTDTKLNGILEDIGAEIGYTATTALVAWFGGRTLYVPAKVTNDHRIGRIIGERAFARLVDAWGSEVLKIPTGRGAIEERDREIADLFDLGHSPETIAAFTGVSIRTVQTTCLRLANDGLVEMTIASRGAKKHPEKAGAKSPTENPPQKAP